MIQTDVLQTVFAVRGLSVLLSAFNSDADAQKRLMGIQSQLSSQSLTFAQRTDLQNQLLEATATKAEAAAKAEFILSAVMAGAAVKALQSIIGALQDAVTAYAEFGNQVLNLRDLTGASGKEAVEMAELFRVAGVKDQQAIRETLRLAKDLQSAKGNAGLAQLGIGPQQGENAVHLMGRITAALNQLPAGLQRTAAAEEIFGARGVQAMLPILRMTEAQRQAVTDLSDSFNNEGLNAIQQFQFATQLLGETVLVKLVYPLAQALLPTLVKVTDMLITVVGWLGWLNQKTGGALALAAAFGAIGLAVAGVIVVIPPLIAALRSVAIMEAIIDALAGQWQNLAAGAAIGITAGIGLYGLGQLGSAQSENTSAMNANTESNARLTGAVNRYTDAWTSANRGGTPRGLQRGDIAELERHQALGIIG